MIDRDTLDYVSRVVGKLAWNDSEHDDLVQEVFIRALTTKNFQGKCSYKTWLRVLAKQVIVDRWRYRNRECRAGEHVELDWDALSYTVNPDAKLEIEEVLEQVAELGETNVAIFQQYYLQEMEMKDIAKLHNLKSQNVKDRIARMRAELNGTKRVRRKVS